MGSLLIKNGKIVTATDTYEADLFCENENGNRNRCSKVCETITLSFLQACL